MSVVTLVSGGLDSTVMGVFARKQGITQFPLFVNYGQLCAERELAACKHVHQRLRLPPPTIMDIRGFGRVVHSGLTDRTLRVKEDAFLPGRNLLLLLCAASYACQVGAHSVSMGLLDDRYRLFPDQSRMFVRQARNVLRIAIGRRLTFITPLMHMSKRDVIRVARRLHVQGTYSCHSGRAAPCGLCVSCLERLRAETDTRRRRR